MVDNIIVKLNNGEYSVDDILNLYKNKQINNDDLARIILGCVNKEKQEDLIFWCYNVLNYNGKREIMLISNETSDIQLDIINQKNIKEMEKKLDEVIHINKISKNEINDVVDLIITYYKHDSKEILRLLNKYLVYLKSYKVLRFVNKLNYEDIKIFIMQCANTMGEYNLYEILKKLKTEDIETLINDLSDKIDLTKNSSLIKLLPAKAKKDKFNKLANKLEKHELIDILLSFDDDDRKELFEQYINLFNFFNIDKIIKSFKENTRKELLIKYGDKLFSRDIIDIIKSFELNTQIELLDIFFDKMFDDDVISIIKSLDDDNEKINLLYKFKDKIIDKTVIFDIINFGKVNIDSDNYLKIKEYMLTIFKKITFEEQEFMVLLSKLSQLDEFSRKSVIQFINKYENSYLKNLDESVDLIVKLSQSNSTEIQHLTPNLVNVLMGKDKSEQDKIINELENVFLKNNLPMMAKLYKVFDIMHPNFGEFNGEPYQSPNLNNKNNPLYKQIILFADLMRITAGSNNRSLIEYVKHIEVGNEIAKELINNDVDIDSLDGNYKEILINYLKHLETLYNNTLYGKKNTVKLSGNIKKDILNFISLFGKNEQEFDIDKLPDRIVKMFGHFAGIDTIDELKILMDTTINSADDRNRKRARIGKFEIHKGYFVKGIANQDKEDEFYSFLTNIFQNGSLCKELLGDAARSDTTPMDTDVSRMLEEPASFEDAFTNPKYASSRYGPLWIVLKDDDRFNETNKDNNKYIPGKLEVFETSMDGQGHYGIRTGFASSDIDYLVVDESRIKMDRIKYEIVMNGFYIPLVNTKGNLVFTPYEYDKLHEKMAGLSYYNTEREYKFAPELDNFDINNTGYNIDIVKSINEVTKVRKEVISKLRETGLDIKLGRSLDLKDKCIDLIDTGSTSRGTNKMNGYDFDFVMRVDKEIYTSDEKMNKLYQSFKNVFTDIEFDGHKIRKYKLKLENGEEVELDITFIMKTNKMDYSTEECLQDRFNTIKNMDEERYKKVLENIVLAKYVLGSVYNSKNAAKNPQGGLGGVGIENWILQNGGSFERAARSFIEKAEGKSFREFTKEYTIWDFGQNNLSFKRDDGYTHDEFITNNMNEEGYNKMVSVLNEYIYTLEQSKQL